MKKSILFISTMYPTPLRPSTKVCHYFVRQWKKMGYEVLVIHFRSMFPAIYTIMASLFPRLAQKYVGNHVEMDRDMKIEAFEEDGIPIYSLPIYKHVPHGKYPQKSIDKATAQLQEILVENHFQPDAIIGHFFNPTLEIVYRLKKEYPSANTCVSLHELNPRVIKDCYSNDYANILNGIDVLGFRSIPIKEKFEATFGNKYNSLVCWSGTPEVYLKTPQTTERIFTDGPVKNFLYVGQTIKRKFPKETVEGVHQAMGEQDFSLTYIGSHDVAFAETKQYVENNLLSQKVSFIGKVPREDIISYYDKSDCFILISKGEVFGLVYLEAMSRGCITIAGKGEGMEGIIQHGVNGFLCEPGNVEELSSLINQINRLSAIQKQTISDNARKKAEELSDYNVAKMYIDKVMGA